MAEFYRILGAGVWKNANVIGAVMAVSFAIQGISVSIAPKLFPNRVPPSDADEKTRKKMRRQDREKRADFGIRVVAFIHASIVSVMCLRALAAAPDELIANVYAFDAVSELIFSISTGYFLWDTLTCIFGGWGIGFISHGIACSFVYASSLYPFLHYWGLFFLLYELSTPFLHLRWIALQFEMPKSNPMLFAIIQYTFVLAFVAVRLVAGTYASYFWWGEMLSLLNGTYHAGGAAGPIVAPHSLIVIGSYLVANLILNGLNWFWFSQMMAMKKGKPSGIAKESAASPLASTATAAATTTTTATAPETADGAASVKKRAPKAE